MSNSEKILFLILLFFVVTAGAQSAPPSFPSVAVFSGWIEINGEFAPEGTVLVAKISGIEVSSYTLTSDGRYGIVIEGTSEDMRKEIEFYVNGIKAEQTVEWKLVGDGPMILNLSITMTTTTTSSSTTLPSEESTTTTSSSSTTLPGTSTTSTSTSTTAEITTTSTVMAATSTVPVDETTTIKTADSGDESSPKLFILAILGIMLLLLLAVLAAMMKRH